MSNERERDYKSVSIQSGRYKRRHSDPIVADIRIYDLSARSDDTDMKAYCHS